MPVLPTSFQLPDLYAIAQFPAAFNPNYPTPQEEHERWLKGCEFLSEKQQRFFARYEGEQLAAHAFPYADAETFLMICDWINLLYVFDMATDDLNRAGAERTGRTFFNTLCDPTYDDHTSLCELTRVFMYRVLRICPSTSHTLARFRRYCKDYIEATVLEASNRERSAELFDLESYITFRRDSSAVHSCFVLAAIALRVDLPDDVVNDPHFEQMHLAAVDMVIWVNDLYSYVMEHVMGHDAHNVPHARKSDRVQSRCRPDHVGVHFSLLVSTYQDAKRTLFQKHRDAGPGSVYDQIANYAAALEAWAVGNLEWSFTITRYFDDAAQAAEVKRTRVVHLEP